MIGLVKRWAWVTAIAAGSIGCEKKTAASDSAAPASASAAAAKNAPSASLPAPAASIDTGPPCDIKKAGDCEQACLGGKASACGSADALLRQPGAQDDPAKRAKLN